MDRKRVFKIGAAVAVFVFIITVAVQTGSMHNLHGESLVSIDQDLSRIEPAAGGYQPETAEKDCVIKARGVGSISSSCD